MKLTTCGLSAALLLGLSVTANAGHVFSSSDYGGNFNSNASTNPGSCTSSPATAFTFESATFSYSCLLDGATITAESFVASTNSDLVVFDFMVSNEPSGMGLVLTPSGAPINSASDLGLFFCSGGSTSPQCNGTSAAQVLSEIANDGSLIGGDAVFPHSSSTLTYFAVLNDPATPAGCDPSSPPCTRTSASVTASFAPATATPEPRLLPILGLVMLAAILIHRRRVA